MAEIDSASSGGIRTAASPDDLEKANAQPRRASGRCR